jgi:cytochrome P450
VTFGGVFIPKDSLVSLVYGSANHDKTIFGKTADAFDIERSSASANTGQNLVFGCGEHRCIGAPMAEQAVPMVIDAFIDQFAKTTLTVQSMQRRDDPYFRGFGSLRLAYSFAH